jgi:hypothetical protein
MRVIDVTAFRVAEQVTHDKPSTPMRGPYSQSCPAKRIRVSAEHTRLQKRLYRYLVAIHGKQRVSWERDRVDIQVNEGKQWTLYEIKPYDSALLCIREALGQIMLYGCTAQNRAKRTVRLVIVGANPLSREERPFFDFLKARLCFDREFALTRGASLCVQ